MSEIRRVQGPPPPPPLPPIKPKELKDALDDVEKLLEEVKGWKYLKWAGGYLPSADMEKLANQLESLFASKALAKYSFSSQYETFLKDHPLVNDIAHVKTPEEKALIQSTLEEMVKTLKKALSGT